MTDEEFNKFLEQTFDSFCKTVIKNAGISLRRHHKRLYEYEVSLDDSDQHFIEDTYELECAELHMDEHVFQIRDIELAAVISSLPIKCRNVILMSFFLEYTDTEIARIYDIAPASIAYRKKCALTQMKELMKGLSHD